MVYSSVSVYPRQSQASLWTLNEEPAAGLVTTEPKLQSL